MTTLETSVEPIATVAGRPVTHEDLQARVAAIRRGPAADRLPAAGSDEDGRFRRWVLRLLVTEATVEHEARRAGIAAPEDASHCATSHNRDVSDSACNGADPIRAIGSTTAVLALFERVTADIGVSEEDVRRYYDTNPDRYRLRESRRVRHVVVADEPAAQQAAEQLQAGAGAGRALPGHTEELRRGDFAGPLEDAVFSTPPGRVAGPLRSELGWHVLRVEAVTEAGRVPYGQVRDAIEADLLAAARGRAFDIWLDERRGSLVAIQPRYRHPGDPSVPDSVHRH